MHLEASFASVNKKPTYDAVVGYDKPLTRRAQNSEKKSGRFITAGSLSPRDTVQ